MRDEEGFTGGVCGEGGGETSLLNSPPPFYRLAAFLQYFLQLKKLLPYYLLLSTLLRIQINLTLPIFVDTFQN